MKNIFFWVATLIFSATSFSQESSYIILEGKIGEFPVVLNMYQEDWVEETDGPKETRWTGNYFYTSQELPIGIGETQKNGKELELRTWDFEEESENEIFKGILENGRFKGTWTKQNKSLPFDLKVAPPNKYTEFAHYKAERIVPAPFKNTEYPIQGSFHFDFFLPKDPKMQQELVRLMYENYTDFNSFSKTELDFMEKSYLANLEEYKDEDIRMNLSNEALNYFSPVLNTENYLVMNFFGYEYTGGAHGMSFEMYFTYDKRKNKWLQIKDVLDVKQSQKINQVLDQVLRKTYKFPAQIPLNEVDDSFFLAESIQYSENFTLSKKGITFHYGLYEMTPYAYGFFELFVSYDDLKPYLNKGFTY